MREEDQSAVQAGVRMKIPIAQGRGNGQGSLGSFQSRFISWMSQEVDVKRSNSPSYFFRVMVWELFGRSFGKFSLPMR